MPFEFLRWILAERFGWTLDEVDALSMADLAQFLQIEDGKSKAGAPGPEADSRPVGRRRR